jgi:hypothetical protein
MAAVPLLSALTDRVDARRVYFFATLLWPSPAPSASASSPKAWRAARCSRRIAGAGLAGTYMPGLKALTDRVGGPLQGRFVAFYTSTFGIGASLSLVLAGVLERRLLGLARGPSCCAAPARSPRATLVLRGAGEPMTPEPAAHAHVPVALLDPRPVLRDRAVLGYVLGYAAHCWELFGLRSWMVAFIAFAYTLCAACGHSLGAGHCCGG